MSVFNKSPSEPSKLCSQTSQNLSSQHRVVVSFQINFFYYTWNTQKELRLKSGWLMTTPLKNMCACSSPKSFHYQRFKYLILFSTCNFSIKLFFLLLFYKPSKLFVLFKNCSIYICVSTRCPLQGPLHLLVVLAFGFWTASILQGADSVKCWKHS